MGGGWAGCSAAYFAKKAGAEVVLIEKTDMLLGTGLVGGIMKNNGRLSAAMEARAIGIGDIFEIIDSVVRHKNINFPGHSHADLYDVQRIEAVIKKALENTGVVLKFKLLITDVSVNKQTIEFVSGKNDEKISGDVFIDTTGTAGPMKNCSKYGTGCAMCILRCPSFGPRISLTGLSGVQEIKAGEGTHRFEAMSGSCKIDKKSLRKSIVNTLESKGVIIIPLPERFQRMDSLRRKACQQYAMEEYATNLIILDTGHAKLMTPFFPIENLREIDGFREARYADPYSGGQGNSVRFMAMAPCDDSMKVKRINNLFCAGEKTGPMVGHTEAIITGALAGLNAVRAAGGKKLRILPPELSIGDIISFMHQQMQNDEGLNKKYSFSGSVYFERMKAKGFYITDCNCINKKIQRLGLHNLCN